MRNLQRQYVVGPSPQEIVGDIINNIGMMYYCMGVSEWSSTELDKSLARGCRIMQDIKVCFAILYIHIYMLFWQVHQFSMLGVPFWVQSASYLSYLAKNLSFFMLGMYPPCGLLKVVVVVDDIVVYPGVQESLFCSCSCSCCCC